MCYRRIALAAVVMSAAGSSMSRADFDFRPYVAGGQIITGGHDDETGQDVSELRVGNNAFDLTSADPYNTGDPGFNTQGASTFRPGSALYLSGQAIDGAYLRYWDGNGAATFGAAPAGASIELSRSPALYAVFGSSGVTYTPAGTSSLLIDNFSNDTASMHRHLNSSIFENGVQDASIADGAYLLSFTLSNPNGNGIADSKPLFIVYNVGLSDAQNAEAVSAVTARYVPEPATASLAGIGAMLLLRRRRR